MKGGNMVKIELRCPRCGSGQIYTRKKDRRCSKCGHEGDRFEFVVKKEENNAESSD